MSLPRQTTPPALVHEVDPPRLETTLERLYTTFAQMETSIADIRAGLQAWNVANDLTHRVLWVENDMDLVASLGAQLRAELPGILDLALDKDQAIQCWRFCRHGVLLVNLGVPHVADVMRNVEMIRNVGRGPRVVLLSSQEHGIPTELQSLAQHLDATLMTTPTTQLGPFLRSLLNTIAPLPTTDEDTSVASGRLHVLRS